jgi:integrative and conjugative element protein (TIGR02256 family)
MHKPSIAWISAEVFTGLEAEASRMYPLETGGVLMGYCAQHSDIVITAAIGPGPAARHEESAFIADHEYQLDAIRKHYYRHNRRETYLGDWHTHPNAAGYLSSLDLRTLRRIAKTRSARVPQPMMLICAGRPGDWTSTCWRLVKKKRYLWSTETAFDMTLQIL